MTTRISMIPNNDVQVIHASQGDTEREWEFELYDNDGLIDTSSIGQQTVYPVYAGGTEQLLPANTATPSTSPMLADIQYPDQLRLEQYFTYRQCPTASDGKAKVKKLYGNSIVFNQLVQNGNFADTSNWSVGSATLTATNNTGVLTCNAADPYIRQTGISIPSGHKVLVMLNVKATAGSITTMTISFQTSNWAAAGRTDVAPTNNKIATVLTATNNIAMMTLWNNNRTASDILVFSNIMVVDLTQMFGSGNEPTAQEFEALFNLPYYQYNQGTLLAFNGTDIKTTGKNKAHLEQGTVDGASGADSTSTTRVRTNYIRVEQATDYIETTDGWVLVNGFAYDASMNYLGNNEYLSGSGLYNTNLNNNAFKNQIVYVRFVFRNSGNTQCSPSDHWLQFEIGSTATAYAPYTEHLTPLPISDYFPSGMKSAGTVYDELSESKAVTRIGTRAYQAGDESDPTVITDKTTTFYPLDNPQTVSFVSASFVSQNIETEMTADNGKLYAKSDGYTDNAGTFPCKIKVASDGVAYSAEFKLHVERKP